MDVCVSVVGYACMHVYVFILVCIRIWLFACVYIYMYVYILVHVCVCMWGYINSAYVCVCISSGVFSCVVQRFGLVRTIRTR